MADRQATTTRGKSTDGRGLAPGTSAVFQVLVRASVDGTLKTSRRHLRAMAGLATIDELHAAERDLKARGLIEPTMTTGNRWAVTFRMTRKAWGLVGTLARATDETIPEALRSYEYADAGRLWARAPKGEPVETRDMLRLMDGYNPNMVYQLVRKLADLPVPAVTITRHPNGDGWVHGFCALDADDWGAVAEHIEGQQDRAAGVRRELMNR